MKNNEKKELKVKDPVSLGEKIEAGFENILCLSISIFGLIASMTASWGGGSQVVHAGMFPRIVLVILGLGSIGMFFSKNKYSPPPRERNIHPTFTIIYLICVGIYVWCALNIGFVICTAVFLLANITVFSSERRKHWKSIVIATIMATAIIWVVFVKIIGIALPQTPLF